MKNLTAYSAIFILLFCLACGDCESDAGEGSASLTKADAAEKLDDDELDYDPCEEYGWYDDGECDDFCPDPDPACDEFDIIENEDENTDENANDKDGDEPDECQSSSECVTAGCNSIICQHESKEEPGTICKWQDEYACYQDEDVTTCGCFEGSCGWDQTDELDQCLGASD